MECKFWYVAYLHVLCLAKEGKKIREKIRKLASKVEEDEFSQDLEMVCGSSTRFRENFVALLFAALLPSAFFIFSQL